MFRQSFAKLIRVLVGVFFVVFFGWLIMMTIDTLSERHQQQKPIEQDSVKIEIKLN